MSKLIDMKSAIAAIPDGALLGIGGNTLNRSPMAAVKELARQRKRGLRLVKTAGGMDVDLLCLAGCVSSVDAGFISYETEFSLCQHYRRAVQKGEVQANEHACYTVISALRAASYGIPFMPVQGLQISDLVAANDYFADVTDPFSGRSIRAVKAIRPQISIIHVQQADSMGNTWLLGPEYDDVLLTRASETVIVTAERIVSEGWAQASGFKAQIPHFLVGAVVHAPRGAVPCACSDAYSVNKDEINSFLQLHTADDLAAWLQRRV